MSGLHLLGFSLFSTPFASVQNSTKQFHLSKSLSQKCRTTLGIPDVPLRHVTEQVSLMFERIMPFSVQGSENFQFDSLPQWVCFVKRYRFSVTTLYSLFFIILSLFNLCQINIYIPMK